MSLLPPLLFGDSDALHQSADACRYDGEERKENEKDCQEIGCKTQEAGMREQEPRGTGSITARISAPPSAQGVVAAPYRELPPPNVAGDHAPHPPLSPHSSPSAPAPAPAPTSLAKEEKNLPPQDEGGPPLSTLVHSPLLS
ncbi:hypothetical protein B0H14DRAFT_3445165 [Mycena olivaceomarginata]|nr:hypothetical protein B0H14DRAFT_3445165 [Mycena olivaceomarginata]